MNQQNLQNTTNPSLKGQKPVLVLIIGVLAISAGSILTFMLIFGNLMAFATWHIIRLDTEALLSDLLFLAGLPFIAGGILLIKLKQAGLYLLTVLILISWILFVIAQIKYIMEWYEALVAWDVIYPILVTIISFIILFCLWKNRKSLS